MQILNRYVFGKGPRQDWDSQTLTALNAVQTWCKQFSDEAKMPEKLIETYKMVAKNEELNLHDITMIAFGILCFLQYYNVEMGNCLINTFITPNYFVLEGTIRRLILTCYLCIVLSKSHGNQ